MLDGETAAMTNEELQDPCAGIRALYFWTTLHLDRPNVKPSWLEGFLFTL